MHTYRTDVAVIGAGLAGITTALELLDQTIPVTLIDGNPGERLGGQIVNLNQMWNYAAGKAWAAYLE